jgi:Amidase
LNYFHESVIITIYNILYKGFSGRKQIGLGMIDAMSITNKIKLAQRELGRSVIQVNPHLPVDEGRERLFFGVKDTNQIPDKLIQTLRENPHYVWLTIDKAADKGRALDTDLTNPLTYRVMTGSSSGGPINILKGINDFAIGTDGGGSVLAPAMSCQLPSIIGAGTGLFVENNKVSTDGLEFTGSIGVIAKKLSILRKVMESLLGMQLTSTSEKARIAIPKRGSVTTPDGQDMFEKVTRHLARIDCATYDLMEIEMYGIDDRKVGIELIQDCFQKHDIDMIITCEGPVDVYGYGETIPMQFGEVGKKITENHGKYLIRAANMAKTTAITVPTDTLASGMVILAKEGIEHCQMAFDLAEKLEESCKLPEVWKRYFLENNNQKFTGLAF